MRKYFVVLVLLIASNFVKAQNADIVKVTQILQSQTIAWNNGNLEAFMQPYWKNDSLMFIGKKGITYGWKNTLENYKKGYPDKDAMGILKFEILDVKNLNTNYISMVGKWQLTRKIGDIGGHFTLLWKKINNEWVIISDHSS